MTQAGEQEERLSREPCKYSFDAVCASLLPEQAAGQQASRTHAGMPGPADQAHRLHRRSSTAAAPLIKPSSCTAELPQRLHRAPHRACALSSPSSAASLAAWAAWICTAQQGNCRVQSGNWAFER